MSLPDLEAYITVRKQVLLPDMSDPLEGQINYK